VFIVFWLSIFLIGYAYIGYPLHIWIKAKLFPAPVLKGNPDNVAENVSIIIAAKNEVKQIRQRIENLLAQDYPENLLEIIIISDGSSDETANIIRQVQSENPQVKIKVIEFPDSQGKPAALNAGIELASGEFIVFTDCRQSFEVDVIRQLIANFGDPSVGCVSGELVFWKDSESQIHAEMGAYWKYEKFVRKNESRSGSVVGATGAIYAIRKDLYQPLPEETLIDDVLTPLNIARQGKRVIFEPAAVAYDVASSNTAKEWQRKVRTLAGNWQLINLCDGLFFPSINPLAWQFIGHKFLRLLVPFALIGALVSSFLVDGWFFSVVALLQVAFYGSAAVAHYHVKFREIRIVKTIYFFVVLNLAALVGFVRWVTGRCDTAWHPVSGKNDKNKGVPVLMYHALEDDQHPADYTDAGDKVYLLQVEQFRQQMEYLQTNGFKTYLIDELLEMDEFPDKAVVLTFDDGHESNATLALAILQEFGFKAEFFITTGWIGKQYFISGEQIRTLSKGGMGIGSHGVTHRFLNNLASDELQIELSESKDHLEKILSQKICGISYPGGRVPKTKDSPYRWGCTSSVGFMSKGSSLAVIPRVAMKHDTSLVTFEKIVHCDRLFFRQAIIRGRFLSAMKQILGDDLYAKIHKALAR